MPIDTNIDRMESSFIQSDLYNKIPNQTTSDTKNKGYGMTITILIKVTIIILTFIIIFYIYRSFHNTTERFTETESVFNIEEEISLLNKMQAAQLRLQ